MESLATSTLAIIGVLYGAFAAWGQTDFKRLIAYSSFSHVNFVLAGLFVWNQMAHGGAILQAVNHAVTIAGLFLVAGWLEDAPWHDRVWTALAGLTRYMPKLSWMTLFFVLSTVALPGLNNFVSEVMVLYGVFSNLAFGCATAWFDRHLLRPLHAPLDHSVYFDVPSALQTSGTEIFRR